MNRAKTRLSILTATMVSAAALMATPLSSAVAQTETSEEELLEEQAASGEAAATTEEEDAAAAEEGTQEDTTEDDEPTGEDEPAAEVAAGESTDDDAAVAEEADAGAADEPVAAEDTAAEDETITSDDEAATTAESETDGADETQVEEAQPEDAATAEAEASAEAEAEVEAEAEAETETETETDPSAEADVADEEATQEEAQDVAEAEDGEEEAQAAVAPPEPEEDVEAAPEVSDEAEEAAAELLADDTPAEKLSNKELRARIAAYRALLEEPQLSVETSDSLRVRLKTDRDVLRVRVAEAEAADVEAATLAAASSEVEPEDESFADETVDAVTGLFKDDDDDDGDDNTQKALIIGGLAAAAIALPLLMLPDEEETVQIVSQPQPQRLEDLTDAELGRRMLALQQASRDDVNYTYAQRQSYENELEISRNELRRRLERDREEREIYYIENDPYDVPINYVMPQQDYEPAIWAAEVDQQQIWQQLMAAPRNDFAAAQYGRQELNRNIEWIVTRPGVRDSLPGIELDTITFGFNEDFLREEELYDLDRIARLIEQVVVSRPEEILLIEGHTDAVGNQEYNWRLSQRRAEAVKDLITRYYLVPPENLVTAGLGEAYLKIWTPQPEEENRRVTLRRITPLVAGYAYQ